MLADKIRISLTSCNKGIWLSEIITTLTEISETVKENSIELSLPIDIQPDKFEPFHIVLLSCFIEHLHRCGCLSITLIVHDDGVADIIKHKLKMHKYFNEDPSSHEDCEDSTILNLWKIVDNMTYAYSFSVSAYFNNNYFSDLDTSGLSSALNEVYANIADHSESKGNAFSYISYNPVKGRIYIAACDFGLGIAKTLRNSNKVYLSDSVALRDSVNIGVTARSTKGNKGMGLDNILSTITTDDVFRIVSNKSLLVCFGNKNNIKTYDLDFDFKGTLIYFELSTDSFPLKDIEDEIIIS